jgi:hypothetical protein
MKSIPPSSHPLHPTLIPESAVKKDLDDVKWGNSGEGLLGQEYKHGLRFVPRSGGRSMYINSGKSKAFHAVSHVGSELTLLYAVWVATLMLYALRATLPYAL